MTSAAAAAEYIPNCDIIFIANQVSRVPLVYFTLWQPGQDRASQKPECRRGTLRDKSLEGKVGMLFGHAYRPEICDEKQFI
ncbi:MAG TPA: hypothetical protein VLE70_19000, partial [Anaerolineae bacterium]|nr:hypothetical protein [Anaerolineae bacterium]